MRIPSGFNFGGSAPPNIVTGGLVLWLDAGNLNSYSGSGVTWGDMSGSGNNGTLINGVGYTASNSGAMVFDGSNDVVAIPNNTALDSQAITVEVWAKPTFTAQNGFLFEKGNINTQYSLFFETVPKTWDRIQWRQVLNGSLSTLQTNISSTPITLNTWCHVVGTYISGTRILYVNGSSVNSDSATGTVATNGGGMSVGAYGGFNGARNYYYNGGVSVVRVYNRALSANEISQNYNAQRGRFGV
jgi:hypothetical protein